jgi:hypothetical protein
LVGYGFGFSLLLDLAVFTKFPEGTAWVAAHRFVLA